MENRTTKRMTELIRWHTPPPNLSRYEENIQIKLNAPYHLANPALRTRLDEFVGFLESKDFRPLETFTELTYRYRDLYGEKPPAGLTYVALFVRVATVEELRAAVSAGWTWDKKTLADPGYDCVGNPAKIWTLHHYVDNVQNFRLPERDPMHHYGITRLGTHTEMYACCGQPLSNPGCWMGKEKFKIEPYVMAPSFGALVWDFVVADEWDSVEHLWMNPPTRGTMWLYKEKYDAWDQQIRKEKERLKGAIVDAFRAVKNEPSKINPLEHMEPMDRIQFEGLLHLQNRYNAIQCQSSVSSAEFFNLERGKEILRSDDFELANLINQGNRLVKDNQNVVFDLKIWLRLKAAKTISDASALLAALKADIDRALSFQQLLDTGKNLSQRYGGRLTNLYNQLKRATTLESAKSLLFQMRAYAANATLVSQITDFLQSVEKEAENVVILNEFLKRAKAADLDVLPIFEQFKLEYQGIRDALDDLEGQVNAFKGTQDDLVELRQIIANASSVEEARNQIALKIAQMQEVWSFDAYEKIETFQSNLGIILTPLIKQAQKDDYRDWPNLRAFVNRLSQSELNNILRILGSEGAKNCSTRLIGVLKFIQGKPKIDVEAYFAGTTPMKKCLTDLANRWNFRATENFTLDEFEAYLETKRGFMPELYVFFQKHLNWKRDECRDALIAFLLVLQDKSARQIPAWVVAPEAKALATCNPLGYSDIIEVLEEEQIDVDRFGDMIAQMLESESESAAALLDEINAVDRNQDYRRIIEEDTSSEDSLIDFVRMVKIEPARTEAWDALENVLKTKQAK